MSDILNRQLLSITGLVQLEKRVRHAATAEEFSFLVVNETHALVRYRQAVLWRRGGVGGGSIVAMSGLAVPDTNAPFVAWLRKLLKRLGEGEGNREIHAVEAAADDWADWLPGHGLWVPLDSPDGERLGALFLVRDEPWTDHDRHLFSYLADAYAHAWSGLLGRRKTDRGRWLFDRRRALMVLTTAMLFGLAWVPVRQSALAPAEIIPTAPVVVRAPFDGVIDRFQVRPNELVAEGQTLLALDPARLLNRLDIARKATEVAEAEYRQAAQQAVFDARTKGTLVVLQGRMEEHAAEVAYLEALLARIDIKAPRNGIVIFDDVNDWIGKPVTIGERILMVADPRETELEIHLPVSEVLGLKEGAEVTLFLNVDPQNPVPARLSFASYQASPTPDGVLAYRLKAGFANPGDPTVDLRIGLKGIAKVYGESTTLFYYLMRRPLAAARQRLGL
jgi:hypothetical protein